MIHCHYRVLDLSCILGCDPLAIKDEHGSAPRVRGDELVGIGGDDSVAGTFTSASCVHVANHSNSGREGFFAVVTVLVGPELFEVGWCFHLFSEFMAS